MDTFNTKRVVFRMIGYEFQDEKFLEEALTAAGAKEEHHDGNRMLAQLGNSLIHMMSVEMGYILRARPGRYRRPRITELTVDEIKDSVQS